MGNRWHLLALLLVPSAVGGCSCGPGSSPVCSRDDQCPSGFLCRTGICVRNDVDAGASDAEHLVRDGGSDRSVLDVAIPEGGLDGQTQEAGTSDGGQVDGGSRSDGSPVDVGTAGDSQQVDGGQSSDAAGPLDGAVPETGPIDSGPVDSGPAQPCGTVSIYQNDFTAALQSFWVIKEIAGGTMAQGPTGLVLMTPASVPSGSAAHVEVHTPFDVDLRGDALTFDMTSATVPLLGGAAFHAQLVHDSGNRLSFVVSDGVLAAEVVGPGGAERWQVGAINLFTPGRWRIREQQGTISFETSVADQDVGAWQSHFATATALHVARGFIQIELGAPDVVTIPGTVAIRSVNLGQPATTWCQASSWQDDFDGILALRPEWTSVNERSSLCILQLNNNQLGIRNPTSQEGECGVVTRSAYSLVDDRIWLQLVSYPQEEDLFSRLVVKRPGMSIAYGRKGGNLIAEISVRGAIAWSSVAALTGNEAWLTISDYDGVLSFEYLAGTDTTLHRLAATPTSLHLDEVSIGVTSLCESACGSGQTLWIDNYN